MARTTHPAVPAVPARSRLKRPPGLAPLVALGLGAAATLVAAAALSARLASVAPDTWAQITGVDQIVELGVLVAGGAIAWWLAASLVTASVCAGARALGRRWSAGERFVVRHAPTIVRRGLALAVGAGVGLAAAVLPAQAQSADPPADLGWVATQVVDASATQAGAPTEVPVATAQGTPAAAAGPTTPAEVTVRAGDSLWLIAAEHLPPDASAADIAAAWPQWYQANRTVIGDDPRQIYPGQILTSPSAAIHSGARS